MEPDVSATPTRLLLSPEAALVVPAVPIAASSPLVSNPEKPADALPAEDKHSGTIDDGIPSKQGVANVGKSDNVVSNSTSHPAVVTTGDASGSTHLPVVLVAQLDSQWVSAIILSLGIIAALVLFIVQSFQHPNVATVLVPLILMPLFNLIKDFVNRKKAIDCPKCGNNILLGGPKVSE